MIFGLFFTPPAPSFAEELSRFGPEGTAPRLSTVEAFRYCERKTRSHYENFNVASFLLPKELRRPFQVVYAYCRWSDDLADENDGSEESREKSLQLLAWWQRGLDDCFSGAAPTHPVYVALREIVREFRLPKKPLDDLLIAFRRDQLRRRYETLDELLDYCRCSADPVGRIVLHLVYAVDGDAEPSSEQLRCSDSICTGLQLANFWQDVARDAEMGRRYIPRQTAERYGVDLETLQDGSAFRAMLRELVEDARVRLLAGKALVDSVPRRIRVDIALFLRGGLAVLDAIEKNGYNVLVRRPVVSKATQLRLLLGAWFGR